MGSLKKKKGWIAYLVSFMMLAVFCASCSKDEAEIPQPEIPQPEIPQPEIPQGVSSQQAIARFKAYFYQDGKVHANRLNSFQPSEWALATDDARKPLDIFMEITGMPVSMKSQYEYSYQSSDGKCNINIKGSAVADTEAVFATINVYIPEYNDIETMHIVTIDYFKGDNSDDIVTGVPVIYAK